MKIHKSSVFPMGDMRMKQALPGNALPSLDPFLLLHHHGPHYFSPKNDGLPFGPHPHKGFETVTVILEGEIEHKDSTGVQSIIGSGGIQWMTAGRGIVHSENMSPQYREKGGRGHFLQLWINLPSRLKHSAPRYTGLQKEQIPSFQCNGVEINLYSGEFEGHTGPISHESGSSLFLARAKAGQRLSLVFPESKTPFVYCIEGAALINGAEIAGTELAEIDEKNRDCSIQFTKDSTFLLGHSSPISEAVYSYGPFVMSTWEEIVQANKEYHAGKFGSVEE